MVTIKVNKNKTKIAMYSHYSYRKRLATINGSYWNPELKAWVAPIESLPQIEEKFKGELYFKTPKWYIEGRIPEPEKRDIYSEVSAPMLKLPLYDYQSDGVEFMIDRINKYGFCLNADDVGLGKTASTLSTLQWYIENEDAKHFIIICKKSLKYQWGAEIEKFTDWDFPVFITGDTPKKRKEAYENMMASDKGILITNYHNYLNDVSQINKCPADVCVIDEVHAVKARNGKQHDGIAKVVRGKKLVLITGTPIMSKVDDIYGIFSIADRYYFGSYKKFEENYLVIEYGIYGRQIIGAKNIDELYNKIHDVMIRRTTDEVSIELPDIIEQEVRVPMDKTQGKIQNILDVYKEKLDSAKEKLLEGELDKNEAMEKIEEITEKEKMYIAPQQFAADNPKSLEFLFDNPLTKEITSNVPKSYKTSNKNEATIDLVDDIISSGEKVIIFTHYLAPAKILKEEIEKKLKINVLTFTGEENEKVREDVKRKFLNTEEYNVLLGNEAMAEGLNLQKAKYIINYEQAETYAAHNQRIGRIRRVGSDHNKVIIYNMITEGTFDEVRVKKIQKDKLLSESLIN